MKNTGKNTKNSLAVAESAPKNTPIFGSIFQLTRPANLPERGYPPPPPHPPPPLSVIWELISQCTPSFFSRASCCPGWAVESLGKLPLMRSRGWGKPQICNKSQTIHHMCVCLKIGTRHGTLENGHMSSHLRSISWYLNSDKNTQTNRLTPKQKQSCLFLGPPFLHAQNDPKRPRETSERLRSCAFAHEGGRMGLLQGHLLHGLRIEAKRKEREGGNEKKLLRAPGPFFLFGTWYRGM